MQKKTSDDNAREQSDNEDAEEDDLEDFMDWRCKTLKWTSKQFTETKIDRKTKPSKVSIPNQKGYLDWAN